MDQVFVFDKSLQQRLNEYLNVLGGHKHLSASQIKKIWSFYLELTLDPNGWQAIWKIPRLTCELLKITFPTIVLVYVESVDCEELSATVKILAVQDDISLPATHIVRLINLWPTREQDTSIALNIETSANCLDMYRFFYNNVFFPWDYEDDVTDWLSSHLESRLRLFYDIKNGVIPHSTSEHILSLMKEALRIQTVKEQVESELDNSSEDDVDLNDGIVKDKRLEKLIELHVRTAQIHAEINILENPLMRNVILKKQRGAQEKHAMKFWLALSRATIDDYLKFLAPLKERYPNEKFTFTQDLEEVQPHDTVILSESVHHLSTIGGLEQGGNLLGLGEKTELNVSTDKGKVMLDFHGEVLLENLTINGGTSSCGVLVRNGSVTLRNCRLVGDGVSSTQQGIIVLSGAKLELFDCDISRFNVAVVGNSGSTIKMSNCRINKATYGVRIHENSCMVLEDCEYSSCLQGAFFVEIGNSAWNAGGFDLLEGLPNITCRGLKGQDNGEADVVINHKYKIEPVKDVFALEEDMDFANNSANDTVLENTDV